MNPLLTRQFLDACHSADAILKKLPALPDGMTPRQLKVIDALYQLQRQQEEVRPSDIAHYLRGTMPSITRMIGDLEAHSALEKTPSTTDKRAHTLRLTDNGVNIYRRYIEEFHAQLAKLLSDISDADMEAAIHVIEQVNTIFQNHSFSIPKEDSAHL